MSQIPTLTRHEVRVRDMGLCIACAAMGSEIMHRIRRREGGHSLSNLALGCHTCHRRCHENPTWAMDTGFILSAVADVDPAQEPIWSWRGWMLLDNEGGFEVIAPRAAQKPVLQP